MPTATSAKKKTKRATTPRPRSIVQPDDQETAIENVVGQFVGCRVAFTWFGVSRGVNEEQKKIAADSVGAATSYVGVRKKLLDTSGEEYAAVTAIRGRVRKYWEAITIPYIEPGWRLIKLDFVASFREQMELFKSELCGAVSLLDAKYGSLRAEAEVKLGTLYDMEDYPATLRGLFDVGFDFPAIHPPECLKFLDETAFDDEVAKFREKLDQTVKLTEASFVEEFTKMVTHIRETLSGVNDDGKPRVFKDATIDNLKSFFDRFEVLNLGSNPKFSEVVAMAKRVVGDAGPSDLRVDADIRSTVVDVFAEVEAELKSMTVVKPKRRVLRSRPVATPDGEGSAE